MRDIGTAKLSRHRKDPDKMRVIRQNIPVGEKQPGVVDDSLTSDWPGQPFHTRQWWDISILWWRCCSAWEWDGEVYEVIGWDRIEAAYTCLMDKVNDEMDIKFPRKLSPIESTAMNNSFHQMKWYLDWWYWLCAAMEPFLYWQLLMAQSIKDWQRIQVKMAAGIQQMLTPFTEDTRLFEDVEAWWAISYLILIRDR